MRGGKNCSPGSLVFAPIPFSDHSGTKRRPVLVLARFADDFLVCNITTNPAKTRHTVPLTPEQVNGTGVREPSVIKVHALSTIHHSLLGFPTGSIDEGIFKRVRDEFRALV